MQKAQSSAWYAVGAQYVLLLLQKQVSCLVTPDQAAEIASCPNSSWKGLMPPQALGSAHLPPGAAAPAVSALVG